MHDTVETEDEAKQRYGIVETGGGQCVVYDRENSAAWFQSDHVVDIER